MAEMKSEKKNVLDYLSRNNFLIPMYQRAYVWGEDECEQLYEDVLNFFNNKESDNDEYFLGSVVLYKEKDKQNIIDGQQRTTTLSLFIRALYEKAKHQNKINKLINNLASCLWDTDNKDESVIYYDKLHLESKVATENDNNTLHNIFKDKLEINENEKKRSLYEKNFLFFQRKIDDFVQNNFGDWSDFCICLLKQCIILPIECDGQDNALRIFNTLNNRGVALSVADIFKGLIFAAKDEKSREEFVKEWKKLESEIQESNYLAKKEDMSFLFMQYQHIIRASNNELDTATPSLLDFWTKKDKSNIKKNFAANEDLLGKDESFEFVKKLGAFWCNPYEYLSENEKKYFDLLNTYQNKLWQMVVSECFYQHCKGKNIFSDILPQVVAYCALGLIYGKGGNSGLYWGFMKANVNIKDGKNLNIFEKSLNFPTLKMPDEDYFIDATQKMLPKQIRYILVLDAMLYSKEQEWEWNYNKKNYELTNLDIEHILPKQWQNANFNGWNEESHKEYLEQIGNKILLEKRLNIKCADNFFAEKQRYYKDSKVREILALSVKKTAWAKEDIKERNKEIYNRLSQFFEKHLA